MLPYLSALTPQIAFTHTVREFIRELLKRFVPGKWIDRVISEGDASFDAKLDAVLIGLDEKTATSKDYRASVVSVLCDEVSRICEVTRLVCINRGYRKYAETFLSTEKFVKLLLRQDFEKLERLNAALDDKTKPLCDLLREIGAILEDKPSYGIAALGMAEVKKANAELKAIAADVKKTMQTGFREVHAGFAEVRGDIAAVGEKVDAVDAKVSKLRNNGKSRVKYTVEQINFCGKAWDSACDIQEIRNSRNTKVSYEAAFQFFHRQLANLGVKSVDEFKSIIRAHQARELRRRQREKSPANPDTKRGENGIMSSMKNRASSTLALTLAIAGALAAPIRSGASTTTFEGGGPASPQGCVAVSYAPRSAKSNAPQGLRGTTDVRQKLSDSKSINSSTLPTGIKTLKGRVVSVADGDTITIIGDENTQYKIRLNAIDAPEKSQAFGQKSKQQLSNYVFGKDVAVKWKSKDKYGRVLGTVFVGNTDINLQMVRDGFAHHYKRFDNSPAYAAAESEARSAKRGLWSAPNPISPEEFRHRDKSTAPPAASYALPRSSAQREGGSRIEYRAGNAMPVSSRTAAPVNSTWPDTGFWLSTNSNKRHNRKCDNYRKTRGYPCSASEGTPCGKCGG